MFKRFLSFVLECLTQITVNLKLQFSYKWYVIFEFEFLDENQITEVVSPSTTASRMVQTFADSLRRQAEYKKAEDLLVCSEAISFPC